MRVTVKQDIGGNTIATAQVSIADSATQIVPARTSRRSVIIVNHGTTDVFLGNSGVTIANGLLLTGTPGVSIALQTTAAVYGIVAAGTQTISYQEDYEA
jgi:hypothetical protein